MGRSRAIICSRHRGYRPFYQQVEVDGLSEYYTRELLLDEAGRQGTQQILHASEGVLRRIYTITQGAPLALYLILGQSSGLDLEPVLVNLEGVGPTDEDFYSYLLARSWELAAEPSRQVLAYLAATAVAGVSRHELDGAQLVGPGLLDAALLQLVTLNLVQTADSPDAHHRLYDLHPLTRSFTHHRCQGEAESYIQTATQYRLNDLEETWRARLSRES